MKTKTLNSKWQPIQEEKEGVHPDKMWLTNGKVKALFKPDTEHNGVDHDQSATEKEVYETAVAIGIPCAKIEIIKFEGKKGCLSYDYREQYGDEQKNLTFIPACEAAALLVPEDKRDRYIYGGRPPHPYPDSMTFEIIEEFAPHLTKPTVDMLFLDCLVRNSDRHGYNWEIAMSKDGSPVGIAPLFDHGRSLDFHKTGDMGESTQEMTPSGNIDPDDMCRVPWAQDVNLSQFGMFTMLTEKYPEHIKELLDRCEKVNLQGFTANRLKNMNEIYERVRQSDAKTTDVQATEEPAKPTVRKTLKPKESQQGTAQLVNQPVAITPKTKGESPPKNKVIEITTKPRVERTPSIGGGAEPARDIVKFGKHEGFPEITIKDESNTPPTPVASP